MSGNNNLPSEDRTLNKLIFGILLTFALISTFITARISRGIKNGAVNSRGLKALLSAFSGSFLLFLYALLLAAKEVS